MSAELKRLLFIIIIMGLAVFLFVIGAAVLVVLATVVAGYVGYRKLKYKLVHPETEEEQEDEPVEIRTKIIDAEFEIVDDNNEEMDSRKK